MPAWQGTAIMKSRASSPNSNLRTFARVFTIDAIPLKGAQDGVRQVILEIIIVFGAPMGELVYHPPPMPAQAPVGWDARGPSPSRHEVDWLSVAGSYYPTACPFRCSDPPYSACCAGTAGCWSPVFLTVSRITGYNRLHHSCNPPCLQY